MDDYVRELTPPPTYEIENPVDGSISYRSSGQQKDNKIQDIEQKNAKIAAIKQKALPETKITLMEHDDYDEDSPPVEEFDTFKHMKVAEERRHTKNAKTGRECLNCACCMRCGVACGHCFLIGFITFLGVSTCFMTLYGLFWCGFKTKIKTFPIIEGIEDHSASPKVEIVNKPLLHILGMALGLVYLYFCMIFFISYYQTVYTNNKPCPYPSDYYGKGGPGEHDPIEERFPVCKRCGRIKPPRAHHDSITSTCYPKMDHRCPMSANVIAWDNYGYFVRFITWGTIDTAASMLLQLIGIATGRMFLGVEDFSMRLILCVLSVMFGFISCATAGSMSSMHIPMVLNNETTIESLDNQEIKKDAEKKGWKFIYPYSINKIENIKLVFGENYKVTMFTPLRIKPHGNPYRFTEKKQEWEEYMEQGKLRDATTDKKRCSNDNACGNEKKEKIDYNKMPSIFDDFSQQQQQQETLLPSHLPAQAAMMVPIPTVEPIKLAQTSVQQQTITEQQTVDYPSQSLNMVNDLVENQSIGFGMSFAKNKKKLD